MRDFLEWINLQETKKIPEDAIKIHLPKVEQTTTYSCGAAALRAIAEFFGVGPEEEKDFIKLLDSNPDKGTTPFNLIRVARSLGLHAFGRQHMTIHSLISRLKKGIPVICCLQAWGNNKVYKKDKSGHYVIAIGFDENKIYFEDPALKKTRGFLSYRDFLDRWHDEDGDGKKFERFGIAIWQTLPPENVSKKKKANVIESTIIL